MYSTPDAGLWEFRTRAAIHTYSALMCWAACDRLASAASHLGLLDRQDIWRQRAEEIRKAVLDRAWNAKLGRFCRQLWRR
ncbi:MAG: glycoside hydrolase family 15 protein [Hyphomonadaceae bacterium]